MKNKINLTNYKAVILAGGKGTRLYPITYEIPKPLLPVKKKPILSYTTELFLKQGIKDVAVLINRRFKEEFNWWKKRYYPKKKIKFVEETRPLGTFGGLWYLKDWIGENQFFLSNADELKEINLRKMIQFHQRTPVLATVALAKVSDPRDYGVVICKNGVVKEFLEKPKNPPTKYINAGLYLLSPEILKEHPGPKFLMVENYVLPKLAKERKLAGFKFDGKWIDCGTWKRYERAVKKIKK